MTCNSFETHLDLVLVTKDELLLKRKFHVYIQLCFYLMLFCEISALKYHPSVNVLREINGSNVSMYNIRTHAIILGGHVRLHVVKYLCYKS